jgi:PKD repeat protein
VGAWEHDLYETSPPKAQISASTNKVICKSTDMVQFKDYSTVRNASATWAWSFPGGTPSTSNVENPIVSYNGAANGMYDVSLTVTDAFGISTQTLNNFITVDATDCTIDTIPGKLLALDNAGDYAQQSAAINITTNTITLSCWIKPNGTQNSFAGIIFSGSDGATGLDYNGTNKLGYHWKDEAGSYNYNSNLIIPENVWSHVALVVTPTSATMYLNGIPATRNATHTAANFNSVFQFGTDRGNNARNFKGLMDEVCIYNRALSTNEIRGLMHLTRNNPNAGSLPANDASLISYYQFNEGAGKPAYDKIGGRHANLGGTATKSVASTAPIGGGTFQRMSVTTGGLKDFSTPGVELSFPAASTYPNGDIVVTRLNVPSDQLAAATILPSAPLSYYVIRNFGTNQTFSTLTSMKFKNVSGTTNAMVNTPAGLQLYKRLSNDHGATWAAAIDNADAVTNNSGIGTVDFNAGLTNTSFSQFSIGVNAAALPVQLLSFTATNIDNKKVLLNWKTADEINLQQYEIEKSGDVVGFKKIGTTLATAQSNYSFTDVAPSVGLNYYRLKMLDNDARFKYSDVKKINIVSKATLVVSSNSNGNIAFSLQGIKSNTGLSLSVTNAAGQLTKTFYLNSVVNNNQYLVNAGTAGVYFVRVTLTDGQEFSEKVVVMK